MSNNDTAMTRFLFAILRQKNLKDVSWAPSPVDVAPREANRPSQIDWNKVARDPILAQEITNGHAARMRYSRFRSAMLGLEPQRRNKTNPDKSRVTKAKKNPKGKKEENVKSEPVAEPPNTAASSEQQPPTPKIKQEVSQTQSLFDSRLTPAPPSSAPSPATQQVIQPRLLTPCSDTDSYMMAQHLTTSPTTEMLNAPAPFDFSTPHYGHDPTHWPAGPIYPTFHTPFEFDAFGMPCGYPYMHLHPETPSHTHPTADTGMEDTNVKHEGWDEHCV